MSEFAGIGEWTTAHPETVKDITVSGDVVVFSDRTAQLISNMVLMECLALVLEEMVGNE